MKLGKKLSKLTGLIVLTGALMLGEYLPTQAAGTVTVSADKGSVSVSDTVCVTVQTSEPEDASTQPEISVTYDPAVLTFSDCNVEYGGGGGGLVTIRGTSASITFTVAATGQTVVSAEAIIDEDGNNPATGAVTLQVGANAAGNLSSDATLRALSVSPGEMTPAFSPETTDYVITIDESVTDITVSGGVSDENAQITAASGFKNLKSGTNQAIITITAQDGSTLSYHFTIERAETAAASEEDDAPEEPKQTQTVTGEGLTVTIDGISYTVQETFENGMLPDGCSKTNVNFNGQNVEAAMFDAGGLMLVYAISDADGSGEFFLYDQSKGTMQLFVQLRCQENRFIVPIPSEEKAPEGFTETSMQWNNSYISAFELTDRSIRNADSFYLLYAVNEEGTKGFYLYDTMEGTYQRFLDYAATTGQTAVTGKMSSKMLLVLGILVILLVGAVMLIVNLMIRNKELAADLGGEDDLLMKGGKKSPDGRKTAVSKEKATVSKEKADVRKEKTAEDVREKAESRESETEQNMQTARMMKEEKEQALRREKEERALALKREKEERALALKKEKEEKAEKARRVKAAQEKARNAVKERERAQKAAQEAAQTEAQNRSIAEKSLPEERKEPVKTKQALQETVKPAPDAAKEEARRISRTPQNTKTPQSAKRAQVPIFTLERQPVPLTREAPPDQLDDDFEFEFINIDNE